MSFKDNTKNHDFDIYHKIQNMFNCKLEQSKKYFGQTFKVTYLMFY